MNQISIDYRLLKKKDLKANHKVVLSLIIRMVGDTGKFTVSNAWISNMLGISTKTISNVITLLSERGFITPSYTIANRRTIYINQDALDEYLGTWEEYYQWYDKMLKSLNEAF